MKIEWNRTSLIVSILSAIIVIGVCFAGYSYYIQPTLEQKQLLADQLAIQEEVIANQQNGALESSTELQRIVPVENNFPALLLQMEEVEAATGSQIMNINVTSENAQAINNTNETNQEAATTTNTERVSYQLNVVTTNFNTMHRFIDQLSELERLVEIDSIQFSQQPENNFNFTVSISTFYSPELSNLEVEAPDYNFEQPANKRNPF
ncbi:hypothetical protein [Radiobacillus sp. PE A8.2]|uniref:hypothetical protein n=1 Tax=Radiobacillus sp. PE A8.2 TaxID=3380349 RepID=UPI00388D05DD